LSAIQLIL